MYYLVNKVLINKEEIEANQISNECLNIFTKNHEAMSFINELKHISIFNEDIILSNSIKKNPITNKDIDGYHIIIDNKNIRKFNIYLKKSSLMKGYIYNSIDIKINYVGFIEILAIKPNIKHQLNLNKSIQKKRQLKYNINTNTILDTTSNNEHKSSENIILDNNNNINSNSNSNKKQKIESNYKHIYLELNDKLIEELKIKLQKLSTKSTI
jgi:hypothetical protein